MVSVSGIARIIEIQCGFLDLWRRGRIFRTLTCPDVWGKLERLWGAGWVEVASIERKEIAKGVVGALKGIFGGCWMDGCLRAWGVIS